MTLISIYTYDGSGSLGATYTHGPTYYGGGFPAQLGSMLSAYDPLTWQWCPVEYKPLILGANASIQRGLQMGRDQIAADPNYIVLSGLSQGTFITSNLYNEFRYGALQSQRDKLIAIVNFGDALRPAGRTIPLSGAVKYLGHASGDVLDPGGHGACGFAIPLSYGDHTGLLTDVEDLYWSFANMGDPATTVLSDLAGALQSELSFQMGDYDPTGTVVGFGISYLQWLWNLATSDLGATPTVAKAAIEAIGQWIPFEIPQNIWGIELPFANPHAKYGDPDVYSSLANNDKSAVSLGFQFLSQLGREYAGDPYGAVASTPTSVGWWVDPPTTI